MPEYQCKGIEKALIHTMIYRATALGAVPFCFAANPNTTRSSVSVDASVFGVTYCEGHKFPAFMGMELIPGYLASVCGRRYYESGIYNDSLNKEHVKSFDYNFVNK